MEEKIRLYIKNNLLSDIYKSCQKNLIALYDRKKSKKDKLMSQVTNMEREFKEYESSIRKLTINDIIQKGFTLEDDKDKLENLLTKTRFFDLELEVIKRKIGEFSAERTMVVGELLQLEANIDDQDFETGDSLEYKKTSWLKMAIFQLERNINIVRVIGNQLFNINAFGIYDEEQLKIMTKLDLNLSIFDEIFNYGMRLVQADKLCEEAFPISEENFEIRKKELNFKRVFEGDFLFEALNNPLIDTIGKLNQIEKSFKIILRGLRDEYEKTIKNLRGRKNI